MAHEWKGEGPILLGWVYLREPRRGFRSSD
jgi:hypothetical protein